MFVTVWAATLDYETGELTYVNAGHNPPLLRHNGTWEWLTKKGGLFLGTFERAKYRTSSLTLVPGDELLLYTDGVNEAFSVTEEEYGNDRLEAFMNAHAEEHPHKLVDDLRADVARWAEGAEQSDDITMVALEYGVAPEAAGSVTLDAELSTLGEAMGLIDDELNQRLCPPAVRNRIDVAFEELYVNVCHYAYAGAKEPGKVKVSYSYTTDPSQIVVEIRDWGVPFDPVKMKDPKAPSSVQEAKIGGLGIMMAKRCVDELTYMRSDDNANVVTFSKAWSCLCRRTAEFGRMNGVNGGGGRVPFGTLEA
jgi:sigma-B regulation protein RsbU (phosphoserine phosphatase)